MSNILKSLSKNRISQSLAAAGLLALSSLSHAESLAITNATVHTVSDKGVLRNAVVVIEDGVISAINPAQVNADKTIDAGGRALTPGLIASMNQLGLTEVSAVAPTNDSKDKEADITFDPSLAFNPKSTLIPYARKGGITRSVIAPDGGKTIFAGQTAVVELSGEFDSVVNPNNAVVVRLGGKSKKSRALNFQTLINKLEDAQKAMKKAAEAKTKAKKDDKKKDDEPSREALVFNSLLKGEKPIVVEADRGSDLMRLIEIKQRFGLKMVINGAVDAITVADQLAKADIAVLLDPLKNLPSNFDSLHAHLENAGKLAKAGVKVLLADTDSHNMYQMRFSVGNSISYGMSRDEALAAMTANVAEAFNINAGTIEVGKPADLVLWSGDLFELNSFVDNIWIGGKLYSTESRHDKLRDRYLKKSDMPPAYSK